MSGGLVFERLWCQLVADKKSAAGLENWTGRRTEKSDFQHHLKASPICRKSLNLSMSTCAVDQRDSLKGLGIGRSGCVSGFAVYMRCSLPFHVDQA